MNISDLLKSTQYVSSIDGTVKHAWGPKDTFATKKFGEIFLYNKTVKTKAGSSVIEISMMIKAVTDTVETSYHRVLLAINGVKQRTVQGQTLVTELENMNPKYKAMDYEEVIASALEGKPYPDKTIIKNESGYFTIIDDNISKENDIAVWCSCSDYFWTWQYYNVENGVDIKGEAIKYENYSGKPHRNPGRHPGMCKHILLLLALLMDPQGEGGSSTIKEARSITRNFKANIDRFKKVDRLNKSQYKSIIAEWEEKTNTVRRTRNYDSDPLLRVTKKPNWRSVQNNMVGKKGRR